MDDASADKEREQEELVKRAGVQMRFKTGLDDKERRQVRQKFRDNKVS